MSPKRRAFQSAPPNIPSALLDAFSKLKAKPVLVGGAAVQVWTGLKEGLFATLDFDFIAPFSARDLAGAGLRMEKSGRHAVVGGVPVEFPSGPLAVGDLLLSEREDTVSVPTLEGRRILCLRPEACVLDRLAWVAADRSEAAYAQALAVAVVQSQFGAWDWDWIETRAELARLSRLWKHLRRELESGHPQPEMLPRALKLGWG